MEPYNSNHQHHLQENQEEEEEDHEEALSLCDLPLNEASSHVTTPSTRRSSSDPPPPPPDQFFEFFSDFKHDMSSAEDIIFHGKLVPFRQKQHYYSTTLPPPNDTKPPPLRRRSESLSLLQTSLTRSSSTKSALMRTSRSLNDYQKLGSFKTTSFSVPDVDRSNSSVRKGDVSVKKVPVKPRWYATLFGVVSPPTEMELRDIKSRQIRRNNFAMFPPVDGGERRSSCRLLKVLSCKDHASVAVATSYCMSQAQV